MLLRLPPNLHYPITITRVEKRVDELVNLQDPLFTYSYTTKVKQGQKYSDEEIEVDKRFATTFNSTLEGRIRLWKVWEGDIITEPCDIIDVTEECSHPAVFGGLCINCGRDMSEVQAGGGLGPERANIPAAHDTDKLTISHEEANRMDEDSKKRLLKARKLILVVDLDQTIIHAAVDPTIGEWQRDPENPNYQALQDVRAFQLVDDGPGMRGCWYYIKLRPGLEQFLETVADKYELHIYTMGTRQYAEQIAKLVDPAGKFFSDRILSRDESGSMLNKNLERLFPVDNRMVAIIDDRGDVWKWSPNLIRVSAFDFFVGIGDINASFLPKKQELQPTLKLDPKEIPPPATNGANAATNGEHSAEDKKGDLPQTTNTTVPSTLHQPLVITTLSDQDSPEIQAKVQEEAIASQLEDKPLLKLQQRLDEKDEAESAPPDLSLQTQSTESDSDSSTSSTPPKPKARHSILRNDDEELIHLERALRLVHEKWFSSYDRKRHAANGGASKPSRVSDLTGKRKAPLPELPTDENQQIDLAALPDIKTIMPGLKSRVLSGVTIVFSGVLPLGTDIQTADISIWAKSFGARISDKVSRDVTHVIAARPGTAKVKAAVKRGIRVVGTDWLMQCLMRWRRVDEKAFLLSGTGQKETSAQDREATNEGAVQELLEGRIGVGPMGLLSEEESEDVEDTEPGTEGGTETDEGGPKRKKIKITIDTAADGDQDRQLNGEGEGDDDDVVEGSPISLRRDEWDDMDDEFKEFMGSDMESESDTDSVRSDRGGSLAHRKKRRRHEITDDEGEGDADGTGRPVKAPRGSALKTVKNVESSAESTPAPGPTQAGEANAEDLDSEDELARELEAAMEDDDV